MQFVALFVVVFVIALTENSHGCKSQIAAMASRVGNSASTAGGAVSRFAARGKQTFTHAARSVGSGTRKMGSRARELL